MRIFLSLVILVLPFSSVTGQGLRDIRVDTAANGKHLVEFLKNLEKQYQVDFIYNPGSIEAYTITGVEKTYNISDFLKVFLTNFDALKITDQILLIIDKSLSEKYGRIKENYVIIKNTNDQRIDLKGQIEDWSNDEPVIGAEIYLPQIDLGVLSDVNGQFEMHVPRRVYEMNIRYTGYESTSLMVAFSKYGTSSAMKIALYPSSTELENVTITATGKDQNITSQITGVQRLGIETIKELPTFMGEVDPIRSLTTLPGVSTVGELSSGFNVRGGENGQNLILQDGAVIYNPTHLFGFFSAFNPDMVNDVTLYKGGGPAQYGGRVASALNITLKNGALTNHEISGGAGLVSSHVAVQGPIIRDKTSFMIGGRVSYSNWLIHQIENIKLKNSAANFYDLTGKIFHRFNAQNYLTLSGYWSYDDFKLGSDSTFSWSTKNLSLQWDHNFNDKILSTLTLASSNYNSAINNIQPINGFKYQNGINNLTLKYDININETEKTTYNFGLELSGSHIEPGSLSPDTTGGNILTEDLNDHLISEDAIFGQVETNLSDSWALSAGLRASGFLRFGPDKSYTYDYDNIQGRYPTIADSAVYENGAIMTHYMGLEPRVSLRYLIDDNTSVKASFYRTYQYIHLMSNTTSPTPQDYWIASSPNIKPEIGDQFSLGYFKNLLNNKYELSLEGFYKTVANTVDYIEGADVVLNPNLEASLAQGTGLAYGLEVYAKKNTGKIYGWISYTYSRSLRRFNSEIPLKMINNGDYYPSVYDQPHNLSVILNYKLKSRMTLSANFSYSTGRPITIPISKFSYDAYLSVLNYSSRNAYRIPDYHRLDVSLTIKDRTWQNQHYWGEWIFSIYNLYGRKNAYTIFFDRYGNAEKISILGSIFPSITYNFNIK